MTLLIISFTLSGTRLFAQERCNTVEYNQYLENTFPGRRENEEFEKWILQKKSELRRTPLLQKAEKKTNVYVIPVVVHVIHNGEPLGSGTNISDEQIFSQLEVLNEDFRRKNPDTLFTPDLFKPVAADAGIEFRLASRDPEGNPTTGINRMVGTFTSWRFTDDKQLKSLIIWPPENYMNVWVCNLSNALGYAQYPESDLPGMVPPYNRETDGIVIDYAAFGSVAKGDFPDILKNYDRGRSATHEIGHFLGLRHIWGDDGGSCTRDDYCEDTPLQADSYSSCTNINDFSCGSQDMYQNYLDYTYDRCMNLFTADQVERMLIVLNNSPRRKSLLTSPALNPPVGVPNDLVLREVLTPTDITCERSFSPVMALLNSGSNEVNSFTADILIEGELVSSRVYTTRMLPGDFQEFEFPVLDLEDGQYGIQVRITRVNEVEDGNPEDNILMKQFLVAGDYDVIPVRNRFTGISIEEKGWSVYNPDKGITWELGESSLNFSTNYSAVIRYFNYSTVNELDWLVSPVLDFTQAGTAKMNFKYSYAQNGDKNDFLQVKVSLDCGKTFPYTAFQSDGEDLTDTRSTESWMPRTEQDWKKQTIDLSGYLGEEEVRVAFIGLNGNGNNLYIDDIEFFVTDYGSALNLRENTLLLHPNPSDGFETYLTINTEDKQEVRIEVIDMGGRVVYRKKMENVLNQSLEMEFPGLQGGVYIIRVQGNTINYAQRLVLLR